MCVVEVEGTERLVPACNTRVVEGMAIHTNTPRVREARQDQPAADSLPAQLHLHHLHPQRKLRAADSGPRPEHPLPALSGEAGAEPAGHGRSRDPGGQQVHQVHALHSGVRQDSGNAHLGRGGYRLPHHGGCGCRPLSEGHATAPSAASASPTAPPAL